VSDANGATTLDPSAFRPLVAAAIRRGAALARATLRQDATEEEVRALLPMHAVDALLDQLADPDDDDVAAAGLALERELGVRDIADREERRERLNAAAAVFVATAAPSWSIEPLVETPDADTVEATFERGMAEVRAASGRSAPRFLSVAEVRAQAASVASTPFLVDQLLPVGSTSIWCGRPKSGKSTLALQLVGAVERGERFLDRATTTTPTVLATEEGASTLVEKLDAFKIERARIVTRAHLGAFGGDAPLRELIAAATAEALAAGAKLLLVDTFAAWSKLGGDRENDSGEVLAALEPLGALAERGIAAVVLHHSRKSETLDPADAVRGSGALAGAFDLVFDLQRADRSNAAATARKLAVLARSSAVDVPEIALDFLDGRYVVVASGEEAVAAGIRRKILDVVRGAAGSLERDEVLDRVGGKRGTVVRELGKLVDGGEVQRAGRGVKGDPFLYRGNGIASSAPGIVSVPPMGEERKPDSVPERKGTERNGLFGVAEPTP
jgi:hypothetical protein